MHGVIRLGDGLGRLERVARRRAEVLLGDLLGQFFAFRIGLLLAFRLGDALADPAQGRSATP